MSPEVLHGQGYDFKSDVWSLGCLLYEFASLTSPFEAPNQTLYDIFKRINTGDFAELPAVFSHELRKKVFFNLLPRRSCKVKNVRLRKTRLLRLKVIEKKLREKNLK